MSKVWPSEGHIVLLKTGWENKIWGEPNNLTAYFILHETHSLAEILNENLECKNE